MKLFDKTLDKDAASANNVAGRYFFKSITYQVCNL